MGCGQKSAAEDAEREARLNQIAQFARKSPIEVLNAVAAMSENMSRLKLDDMRLTASERHTLESVRQGLLALAR